MKRHTKQAQSGAQQECHQAHLLHAPDCSAAYQQTDPLTYLPFQFHAANLAIFPHFAPFCICFFDFCTILNPYKTARTATFLLLLQKRTPQKSDITTRKKRHKKTNK